MARPVKKTNNNYTNVSNVLARDKRLSWKARGIFLYMWSQADNWQFYVKEIASHSVDGERALTSGLKELETYGYLIRKHRIAKHGGFAGMDWILTDCPEKGSQHNPQNSIDDKTAEKNGKRGQNVSDTKRTGYDSHPIQNSSLRNNNSKNYQYKEITNTSKQSASASDALSVPQLESEFEAIWSGYPNKKGKKEAFNHYKAWRKKSKKNTNDYLVQRLNAYKKYIADTSWYHPMNGSTWFNGRFDDDWSTDNSSTDTGYHGFADDSYYTDHTKVLDDVSNDDLPF